MAAMGIYEISSVDDLERWFADASSMIGRCVGEYPVAWSGQMQLDFDGTYVSDDDVARVLPTAQHLNLYLCMSGRSDLDGLTSEDVFEHLNDPEWLTEVSSALIDEHDPDSFYLDAEVPEAVFSHEDLVDLALDRPDLFEDDDLRAHSGLVSAAWEAGMLTRDDLVDEPSLVGRVLEEVPDAFGGEKVYVSWEEGFAGPHTLPELQEYFENEPELAEQREAGSTFDTWMAEMEHMGILVEGKPTSGPHTHEGTLQMGSACWNAAREAPICDVHGHESGYRFAGDVLVNGDGDVFEPFAETAEAAFYTAPTADLGQGTVMLNIDRNAGTITFAGDNEHASNALSELIEREAAIRLDIRQKVASGDLSHDAGASLRPQILYMSDDCAFMVNYEQDQMVQDGTSAIDAARQAAEISVNRAFGGKENDIDAR